MDKTRCFADNGDYCSALREMKCKDCKFYKSIEQYEKEKKRFEYAKKYMLGEK